MLTAIMMGVHRRTPSLISSSTRSSLLKDLATSSLVSSTLLRPILEVENGVTAVRRKATAGLMGLHQGDCRESRTSVLPAAQRTAAESSFDRVVEDSVAEFYAGNGKPGIVPGVYFHMLFIGDFEGIDTQRGTAWRCQASLS